ncbi:hypothetical protein D3C75_954380 [compost metagenome]
MDRFKFFQRHQHRLCRLVQLRHRRRQGQGLLQVVAQAADVIGAEQVVLGQFVLRLELLRILRAAMLQDGREVATAVRGVDIGVVFFDLDLFSAGLLSRSLALRGRRTARRLAVIATRQQHTCRDQHS